jgi:hypothetical protein
VSLGNVLAFPLAYGHRDQASFLVRICGSKVVLFKRTQAALAGMRFVVCAPVVRFVFVLAHGLLLGDSRVRGSAA